MKKLFWTRIINDPEKKEPTIWKTITEAQIKIEEIESAFSDNRMAPANQASTAENVIKVTGPVVKQYFTPEESKSIQMSVNKLP